MSVAAIRNNLSNISSAIKPTIKQEPEYIASKKLKKEDVCGLAVKTALNSTSQTNENSINIDSGKSSCQTSINVNASGLNSANITSNCIDQPHGYNGSASETNGMPNHFSGYSNSSNLPSHNGSLDSVGPLPNEIFELLNEFWRPNELVAPDTHLLNGKFSRRSPDVSLEENGDEEKG